MSSEGQRHARVRNGSRRRRDLAVAHPDFKDWVANQLPDEHFPFAVVAAELEFLKREKAARRMPTAAEVQRRLAFTGRGRIDLEAGGVSIATARDFGWS